MTVKVASAHDIGNDRLLVTGTIEDKPAKAYGWVSAMENYYDPSTFTVDDAGHRHAETPMCLEISAKGDETENELDLRQRAAHVEPAPRPMTADERLDYCRALLSEANPVPVDLGISG